MEICMDSSRFLKMAVGGNVDGGRVSTLLLLNTLSGVTCWFLMIMRFFARGAYSMFSGMEMPRGGVEGASDMIVMIS